MFFGTSSNADWSGLDLFPERARGNEHATTNPAALERRGEAETLESASVHAIETRMGTDDRSVDVELRRVRHESRGEPGRLRRHGDELEAPMEGKRLLPDCGPAQSRETYTSDCRLSKESRRGGDKRTACVSLPLHGLVSRALGGAPAEEDWDRVGREASAVLALEARVRVSTTQTHVTWATESPRGACSEETAGRPKKGLSSQIQSSSFSSKTKETSICILI